MTTKMKDNVFSNALTSILGSGVNDIFTVKEGEYQDALIPIDLIDVKKQVRLVFEDEENTIQGLADDIAANGLLNPITLQIVGDRYGLVAGERRLRACMLLKWDSIPSRIKTMTDEEAKAAQFAENTHRLNLKLAEEATRVQECYLEEKKNIKKTAKRLNKSEAYVSKRLSLFSLPEQAKRVITENASADVEVITSVKTIEKIDAGAAKELVDKLAANKGGVDARSLVSEVKAKVKPKKVKEPDDFNKLLSNVVTCLCKLDMPVENVLASYSADDSLEIESWCKTHFIEGGVSDKPEHYIIESIRNNMFGGYGVGCLALASFLHGMRGNSFSVGGIFDSVKRSNKE